MKKIYFLILFLLTVVKGYCDEGRYRSTFRSKNEYFELHRISDNKYKKVKTDKGEIYQLVEKGVWVLKDLKTKRNLYELKGDFSSKTVKVSNDGNYIIVLDDYSTETPSSGLVILEFFKQGKLLIKYSLEDLICSPYNVSHSASHFSWMHDFDFSYGWNTKFNHDIKTLTLSTFELKTYEFDILTGRISKEILDSSINRNSILVYGEVKHLGRENYEIDVCHRVYGQVPRNGKIKFISNVDIAPYKLYQTVLINNGKYSKTKFNLQHWILNECKFKYEENLPNNINKRNNCL